VTSSIDLGMLSAFLIPLNWFLICSNRYYCWKRKWSTLLFRYLLIDLHNSCRIVVGRIGQSLFVFYVFFF
jgi:hypothetical protein